MIPIPFDSLRHSSDLNILSRSEIIVSGIPVGITGIVLVVLGLLKCVMLRTPILYSIYTCAR